MEHSDQSIQAIAPRVFSTWGFWAILTGGLAVILVFAQIIGPMFEDKPSAASQIGAIAGEIKRSAWASFLGGASPEPEPANPSLWTYVSLTAPVLAVIAIVLSVLSGVMRENWRFAVYGTGLGVTAIIVHFLWWVALLIVGAMILVAIIENIGDIFSF